MVRSLYTLGPRWVSGTSHCVCCSLPFPRSLISFPLSALPQIVLPRVLPSFCHANNARTEQKLEEECSRDVWNKMRRR